MIGYSRAFNELYGPKPIEGKSTMNERVRELLVEAGVINNNFNPLAYEQWYLDALEKFTELIVRECADIANEPGARIPGYYIKKHFGVEQ